MPNEKGAGITAEQMEKLGKLGTSVKSISTTKTVEKTVVPPRLISTKPNTRSVEANIQSPVNSFVENNAVPPLNPKTTQFYEHSTYISLLDGQEPEMALEIDLITFREKGEEIRYVTFQIAEQNADAPLACFNITSKNDFETLKSFMAQLNWED